MRTNDVVGKMKTENKCKYNIKRKLQKLVHLYN
jgi:hypothetical protein